MTGFSMTEKWSQHHMLGTALTFALLSLGISATATADVDKTLNKTVQAVSSAPVFTYEPAVDKQAPHLVQSGAGNDAPTPQIVSADVNTLGTTGLDYVGLILDRDTGDNLFIKVQNNGGGTKYTHLGFYHTNGDVGGWSGITGGLAFFTLAAADQFTSARMTVIHDGLGNVTLQLTNVVGGTNNQQYTRGGWVPRNANGRGFGCFNNTHSLDNWGSDTICDNFNRANGALGIDWVTIEGTTSIVSNTAHGTTASRAIYAGSCSGGLAMIEADIGVVGTGDGNVGLALNYDGVDNLFIKIQQQLGGGQFDAIGFYHISGPSGGWAGITGGVAFFTLPVEQRFTTAHMKVILEASGNVRLILTNMDDVVGPLEFSRGGWVVRNGHVGGFGGWTGNAFADNIGFNSLGVCEGFNRANGALGANWQTILGTASIVTGTGRGNTDSVSVFVGECGTNDCDADIAPTGGNGVVNIDDLLRVINEWGNCPG